MEDAGESTDDMATSVSSLQKKILALTNNKVDIMLNADTFKNTTEILREMSTVWKDMTDIQQANALDLLGGKRQANILAAIINNFDTVEEAIKSSQDSAGSALAENEKYMDSIQGRIDQFNNSIQTLWKNTLDDSVIKQVVNLGTSLVRLVDKLEAVPIALGALFTIVAKKYFNFDVSKLFGNLTAKGLGAIFGKEFTSGVQDATANVNNLKASVEAAKQAVVNTGASDASVKALKDEEEKLAIYEKLQKEGYKPVASHKTYLGQEIQKIKNYKAEMKQLPDEIKNAQKQLDLAKVAEMNYGLQAESDAFTNGVDVDKMQKFADKTKEAQQNYDTLIQRQQTLKQTGSGAFKSLAQGASNFATQLASIASQMLVMMAITTVLSLIKKGFDAAVETAEEAKESFDDLKSRLDATKSDVKDLQSQLDALNDQIKDITDNTPLSFTDQAELARLKEQTAELERQKEIAELLQQQQQAEVNNSAVTTADKNLEVGVKTGKTAGENIGSKVGTGALIGAGAGVALTGSAAAGIGAAVLGAKAGTAIGTAIAPVIGTLIGAAVGALAGVVTGVVVGGIQSASEETIGESLENMQENYLDKQKKMQETADKYRASGSEKDKKKYDEAQKDFTDYQSTMAQYLKTQDEFYNSIDLSIYKDSDGNILADKRDEYERLQKEMQDFYDTQDTWAIQSGGKDAKANAISRIFGEEATNEIKAVKKAFEDAKGAINLKEAFGDNVEAYDAFVARMLGMGVYTVDVENYFGDLAQAEKDALEDVHTYDTVKQIANITKGVNALKSALEELRSEGQVSSDTIIGMYDDFKDYGDAWEEWVDVVSTGTSTMAEIQDKTSNLVNEVIQKYINDGKYDPKEYQVIVSRLQKLGVQDAQNYVDQTLAQNAIEDITQKLGVGETQTKFVRGEGMVEVSHGTTVDDVINASKEQYGDLLADEKYRTAIEKQIALEKAKQAEEKAKADALTYKSAQDRIGVLEQEITELEKESAEYLEQELGHYGLTSFNPEDWLFNGYSYEKTDEYGNKEFLDSAGYEHLKESIENGYAEAAANKKIEIDNLEATVKVTDVDVKNATEARELAGDAVEAELGTLGLNLKIKLFDDSALVDDIQSVFDTLKNAQKEYNENGGYMTVDTLQEILKLEPKYIALLYNEAGQLDLTTESLKRVAIAKINNMTISQAQGLIDQATLLLSQNKIDALRNLTVVTDENTEATWDNVQGNLAAFQTQVAMARAAADVADQYKFDGVYEGVASVVNGLMNSTKDIEKNFDNAFSSAGNTAKSEAESEWDRLVKKYQNELDLITNEKDLIQAEIDKAEARGEIASEVYYSRLIGLEKKEKEKLQEKQEALQKYLNENENSIDQNTWTEYNNEINDTAVAIATCEANLAEFGQTIENIHWEYFEKVKEDISDVTSEIDFLKSLLEDDDIVDDAGNWTSAAMTRGYLAANGMEAAARTAKEAGDEINALNDRYAEGAVTEEIYKESLRQLTEEQRNAINQYGDYKDAIMELAEARVDKMVEAIEEETEAYNDYIDVVKESLDAQRELFDFKKNVQKQTKDIASLERRIASLSGSQNQSDIAERRKLEAELLESKESLNDTYLDNSRSAQDAALDAEATAYEESQNRRTEALQQSLEDKDKIIADFLIEVATHADESFKYINDKADIYDIDLSPTLSAPWAKASEEATKFKNGAVSVLDNIQDKVTAYADFFSGEELNKKLSVTPFTDELGKIVTKWDDIKKAADAAALAQVTAIAKQTPGTPGGNNGSGGDADNGGNYKGGGNDPKVAALQSYLNKYFNAGLAVDGSYGSKTKTAVKSIQKLVGVAQSGTYGAETSSALKTYWTNMIQHTLQQIRAGDDFLERDLNKFKQAKGTIPAYAKGTFGAKRDQIALTDEYGPELTLVPTAAGNLSFMRAGTGVVPADLTKRIMEIAQMPTGAIGSNIVQAMMPNVSTTNNAISLNFESFIKAENISDATMPELSKMVDKKIDDFTRKLNYAIKRV